MDNFWLGFKDFANPGPLQDDVVCDYLIVGAGVTGLSIAYHLLKSSHRKKNVVIIDAKSPGFGASGKSSGMLGPGIGLQFHKLVEKYGIDVASMAFAETQQAVRYSISEISAAKLNCDIKIGKQLKVAKDRYSMERLKLEGEVLARAGFDIPYLGQRDVMQQVGVNSYKSALQYNEAATVNPVKLLQGLVSNVISLGGKVYFNTPINLKNIGSESVKKFIKIGEGSIRFDRVVLTTNGFSGAQGVQKNRVIPISTSMIVSETLTEKQLDSLGLASDIGVIESSRLFNYFRLTEGNQLLFGGGKPCYSKENISNKNDWEPNDKIYSKLMHDFSRLYPDVTGLVFSHQWSGTIGVTLDNFPVVHVGGDGNIDSVMGWCGHGLAMSFLTGKRYSDMQQGAPMPPFPWLRSRAPYLAPSILLGTAANGYLACMSGVDALEFTVGN
jgi:gamma-glutamylputrescine oxidase